jgi:hypothetical protein
VCVCVCLFVCVFVCPLFLKTTENENEKLQIRMKQSTLIRKKLFARRIEKKMDEMEDNVPIGMKRKACKKTAEEKRTADVNALQ